MVKYDSEANDSGALIKLRIIWHQFNNGILYFQTEKASVNNLKISLAKENLRKFSYFSYKPTQR